MGYIDGGVLTEGEAWVPISSQVLSSDADVTFSSGTGDANWSQYMDLMLICYARSNWASSSATDLYMRLSGATSNGAYQVNSFKATGWYPAALTGYLSTTTTSMAIGRVSGNNEETGIFSGAIVEITDINSAKTKYIRGQWSADTRSSGSAGLFSGAATYRGALSSIGLEPSSGTFLTGSRFDLYGILPKMVA